MMLSFTVNLFTFKLITSSGLPVLVVEAAEAEELAKRWKSS
jgi:hypothetical protein